MITWNLLKLGRASIPNTAGRVMAWRGLIWGHAGGGDIALNVLVVSLVATDEEEDTDEDEG